MLGKGRGDAGSFSKGVGISNMEHSAELRELGTASRSQGNTRGMILGNQGIFDLNIVMSSGKIHGITWSYDGAREREDNPHELSEE